MNTISFVIPCYNSAGILPTVVQEIRDLFQMQQAYDYQILLCNDGSPDEVWQTIKKLYEDDSHILGLSLTRNFGQQAARMALLPYITGDYVVFTDDDGQHPLEYVFPMIQRLQEGYDAVYASFTAKKHSLMQRIGSKVNQWMMETYLGKPKNIKISSFFVLRRFVVDEIKQYVTPEPYINGYVLQVTRNISNIAMPHKPRLSGTSGYTFSRLVKVWFSGVTSFSAAPLRTFSMLGFIVSALGFLFGLVIVARKILNPAMAMGYASLMAAVLFIGGMIIFMIGMLGEYISRMFMRVNNLPQYVVRESTKEATSMETDNKRASN